MTKEALLAALVTEDVIGATYTLLTIAEKAANEMAKKENIHCLEILRAVSKARTFADAAVEIFDERLEKSSKKLYFSVDNNR